MIFLLFFFWLRQSDYCRESSIKTLIIFNVLTLIIHLFYGKKKIDYEYLNNSEIKFRLQ